MSKQFYTYVKITCAALLLVGFITFSGAEAYAADGDTICTNFETLETKITSATPGATVGTPGILSTITTYIKDTLNNASQNLFRAFTDSPAYRNSVNAAITLMVIFYGVAFLIGVVQASFGQVLIRMVKMGIVLTLISSTGWTFFSENVVQFFNDGTDEIIGQVMAISTGQPYVTGTSPFIAIDSIAQFMLSPSMIIAIIGTTLNGGPFGLAMGGLLAFAFGGFISLLIQGLKIYALTFMVRALLLGVAPVFFVFMLFDKTRQIFSGWINVMVSMSLQPILFFTFLSFFLVMLGSSAKNLMGGNELCWTEHKSIQGGPNKGSGWRFQKPGEKWGNVENFTWQGSTDCLLSGGKEKDGSACKSFPINIIDLLTFLILVYVAKAFAGVVEHIANEISNSSINLDTRAKAEFGKGGGAGSPNQPAGGQTPRPPTGKRG